MELIINMKTKKTTIAFTIDHTFRDVFGKIVKLYNKFYVDEPEIEAQETNSDFTAPILTLPITSTNLMNHIPFESTEAMEDFIFVEFPLEIFGYANESESGIIRAFNMWIESLPENINVILISNEIGRTKPSTLFFLSKTGSECNTVTFIDDNVNIWDYCDTLVTSGEVKTKKPRCKKLIIIDKPFNQQLTGDIRYNSLFDLFTNDINKLVKPKKWYNKIFC